MGFPTDTDRLAPTDSDGPTPLTTARSDPADTINLVATTQSAWRSRFFGDTVTVFRKVLEATSINADRDYARFTPIVQSSGMGKSRLIDQYALHTPGVVFTLRRGNQAAYQTGDVEITVMLLPKNSEGDTHAMFVALLAGGVDGDIDDLTNLLLARLPRDELEFRSIDSSSTEDGLTDRIIQRAVKLYGKRQHVLAASNHRFGIPLSVVECLAMERTAVGSYLRIITE
ncbi:hypothetical protein FN846DRAFT_914540 [Sphaerosporella brunnea]|uniref:Uncharacterized protein n=1 Tax=Sphaerosporella brunnea TaxID=1250544 RepID=A0A5J5ECD8_9PEZI|nr:hypothetical protein FN846DRAFT_914540 [Sphaerosporella brunnea]